MASLLRTVLVCSLLITTYFLQVRYSRAVVTIAPDISADKLSQQNQTTQSQLTMIAAMPVFGFDNIVSSWVFLRFLQYFGNSDLRIQSGYALSSDFFEVIIDRDPRFVDSYLYLSNSVSIYAGKPKDSVRLMEKGLSKMSSEGPSKSYIIWRNKAVDELLFLGDTQAAKASHEMAANWAEQSSDVDAMTIARLSRQTATFLATDPSSKSAQISSWSQVLVRAIDDKVRQKAITHIKALGGEILVSENGQVTIRYNSHSD